MNMERSPEQQGYSDQFGSIDVASTTSESEWFHVDPDRVVKAIIRSETFGIRDNIN